MVLCCKESVSHPAKVIPQGDVFRINDQSSL